MPSQLKRFAFIIVLIATPALAAAQQPSAINSTLTAGTHFVQLPFPTDAGSGTVGFWKMRSDRSALGIVGTVHITHVSQDSVASGDPRFSNTDIELGPAFRRYYRVHPNVAGYGTLGVSAVYHHFHEINDTHGTFWGGNASVGIGAEWFPFERVSLGGTSSIRAGFLDSSGATTVGSQFYVTTATSSVGLTIYF